MIKKQLAAVVIVIIIIVIVALFSYYFLTKDEVIERDDESPLMRGNATIVLSGTFNSSGNYNVEGKALLINNSGKYILRFEDFKSDTGPGLYIYLSADLTDDDFIDLGKIKAHEGNVNYDIPQGVDFEKYDNALVWCEPFGVLFGYSELS